MIGRPQQVDNYLARGKGLVMLHSATIADRATEHLAVRIGFSFQPEKMKYRHGPLDLKITSSDEPITRGLDTVHFYDETYWTTFGDPSRIEVVATADEEDKSWPMMWKFSPGQPPARPGRETESKNGRVFCSVLGHYAWTYDDPLFRLIILRATAWAAGEPVDRFEALAVEGVQFGSD